jgi:hypothetical protein
MNIDVEQIGDLIANEVASKANNAKKTDSLTDLKKLTDLANQHEDIARKRADTDDKKADIELKKLYATRFLWILSVQLIAMNGVFVAVGLEKLEFSDIVLNLFMGGTLAEVFGVVFVITRYLFSKK